LFQEEDQQTEQLLFPNKSRAKRMPGMRLPNKKKKKEVTLSAVEIESKHHPLVGKIFSQINKNSPISKSNDCSKIGPVQSLNLCRIDSVDFNELWFFRVPTLLKPKHGRKEDSNKSFTKCDNNNTKFFAKSPIEANDDIVINTGTGNVKGQTEKKNICMMCKLM
jgi:hypothetical protein